MKIGDTMWSQDKLGDLLQAEKGWYPCKILEVFEPQGHLVGGVLVAFIPSRNLATEADHHFRSLSEMRTPEEHVAIVLAT